MLKPTKIINFCLPVIISMDQTDSKKKSNPIIYNTSLHLIFAICLNTQQRGINLLTVNAKTAFYELDI